MFDIQRSGTANRLNNPIAIIGGREAYKQLCDICNLNPGNNDVFVLVQSVYDTDANSRYSRVLEIDGAGLVRNRLRVLSDAHAAVRN